MQNVGSEFCVRGCHIARGEAAGYMTSEDTKRVSHISHINLLVYYVLYLVLSHHLWVWVCYFVILCAYVISYACVLSFSYLAISLLAPSFAQLYRILLNCATRGEKPWVRVLQIKRNDYRCLWNESQLAKKGFDLFNGRIEESIEEGSSEQHYHSG